MRKWLWRCAAAGVVTAAGAFSAVYYAWHHPDSYLGRCFSAAAEGGMLVNTLSALGVATSEDDSTALAADGGSLIPDDPVPVLDAALLPAVVNNPDAVLVETVALPQITSSTPIVIEHTPAEGEAERAASDNAAALLRPPEEFGPSPAIEVAAHRPMIMPYADDDDRLLNPMPFAEAEESAADDPCTVFLHSWMDFFGKACESAAGFALSVSEGLPSCEENAHHYDQQYPGCPNTGCPARDYHPFDRFPVAIPRQAEPEPKTGGGEENSELMLRQLTPRLQKKLRELIPGDVDCEKSGTGPKQSGIDTMEFRRSDRTLRELAPGGPY
jgi:hypothetical protein